MSEIELDIDDRGVALVTLNAAERRNAMNLEMVAEIVTVVESCVANDDVGALVVTGAGKGFCAGAVLDHLAGAAGAGAAAREGLQAVYAGFLAFAHCPKPTVAAVNGAAVGAGMNLALACDLRVASRAARFVARFLDLGLAPGGGHTWMLQRLMGPQAAAAAVLFGQEYDGETAVRVGLAYECTEPDELVSRATELAARAASMPPELARRTKATMRATANLDTLAEAVQTELDVQAWSLQQPEFKARLDALQKKS